MPQKPPAPNPPPPRTEGLVFAFAMHRWRYPYHHSCGHFRGYLCEGPTRCAACKARDRRDDRRRIAGAALACAVAFFLTLTGCCAAGGALG